MGRVALRCFLSERRSALVAVLGLLLACACAQVGMAQTDGAQTQPRTPPAVGTIKSISANSLTLLTDAGAEVKVALSAEVKVVRVPPGSKDLKEAVAISISDLQEGDRILVRGKPGDAPGTLVASTVVAMKKADIADKQAHEREEWQRHGTGGLVKSVDAAGGVITIGVFSATGSKDVAIHVSKTTILRRYAPGSVKFDDAKPSVLADVKAGDQVRARGTRSPDGLDFSADEIVSGSFRNIAGTIVAIDAKAGTVTVNEPRTKKSVEVKITADSQLRKLPLPMAQRIAMRLKGIAPDANPAGGPPAAGGAQAAAPQGAAPGGGASQSGGGMGAGAARGGGGDLQQMLSRLPVSPLTDFQKGDAVMIVASAEDADSLSTAITLLGGVEPILLASPQGQAASILTPWSLSNGGADAGTP